MMMTGSCGESCGAVAAKYAAMISSKKDMLFLLKLDLTYTAREEGPGVREQICVSWWTAPGTCSPTSTNEPC